MATATKSRPATKKSAATKSPKRTAPQSVEFAMPRADLMEALRNACVFRSNDASRPPLMCVQLTRTATTIELRATDSYRLAVFEYDLADGPKKPITVLIDRPAELLAVLKLNALPAQRKRRHAQPVIDDVSVTLQRDADGRSSVSTSDRIAWVGGTDIEFPSTQQLIDDTELTQHSATAFDANLLASVGKVRFKPRPQLTLKVEATDRLKPCRFTMSAGDRRATFLLMPVRVS